MVGYIGILGILSYTLPNLGYNNFVHLHRNLSISETTAHITYACRTCGWEKTIDKVISESHE